MKERFEQESYHIYSKLEQLILKGDQGDESDELFNLYHDDFNRDTLQVQLSTFYANYSIKEETGIHGVVGIVKACLLLKETLFQN